MNTLKFPKKPIQKGNRKSLKYAVQNVMLDLNETGTQHYQRYLQWGIRGIMEIGKFTGITLRTKLMTSDSQGRIYLPDDYVRYTKIGVVVAFNGQNRVLILGHNKEIAKMRKTDECGASYAEAITTMTNQNENTLLNNLFYFTNYYHNGQYVGGVFGEGGGFTIGYYTVDEEFGYVQLTNEMIGQDIMFEYISTGVSVDGDTTIPTRAVETLIAWIHWKRLENKRNTPVNQIREKRLFYVSNLRLLKKFEGMFTGQEFLDMTRAGNVQTVKG